MASLNGDGFLNILLFGLPKGEGMESLSSASLALSKASVKAVASVKV
jgi:hypothetical protein